MSDTHTAARVACCTKHLGKAMRFLMLSKGETYDIKAVRLDRDEAKVYICECGGPAAYYFRLIGTDRKEW